jgi:hypothetical protein
MEEVTEKKRAGRPPRKIKSQSLIARTLQEGVENTKASAEELEEIVREAPKMASERPAMRPSMRDEDPRAAAARRAAEIRGHLGGSMDEGLDEFAAPPPPPGWSYEWKRRTVMGQEDPAYLSNLARGGWEPVPTARHPEMMPHNTHAAVIERKGQMLMMRPKEITDEVHANDQRRARERIEMKKQQLTQAPTGHFERTSKDVKVNKSYVPLPVPNE